MSRIWGKSLLTKISSAKISCKNFFLKVIQKKEKQTKTSALPKFMPQKLPGDEIAEGKNSLNSKKIEFSNVIHNMMSIMLNQSKYFFQAVEVHVNLI